MLLQKQLGDSFFAPGLITNGSQADSIADIARGYSSQKAAAWDNTFEEVLINQLFGNLDLTALNIQRARDWGITGKEAIKKKTMIITNLRKIGKYSD